MRVFELANKTDSKPVVYVDMDGVLADMFGEVAKREGVSHWRKARKEKDRIDQAAQVPGFFLDLTPLPNAPKLLRGVLAQAGEFSILSSPLMSNVEQSVREKTEWLNHYLKSMQPTSVLFDHNKEKFARQADGTPNILIDDWDINIKLWESNGGIGILYADKNCDRALEKLKVFLMNAAPTKPVGKLSESLDPTKPQLLTNRQVLDYIQDIHHEYHLDKPILKHKTWILRRMPVSSFQTPEFYDQDDPYRRLIDLDWSHIEHISSKDIINNPVVADEDGWILDGNHRVIAARAQGIRNLMAIVPYVRR